MLWARNTSREYARSRITSYQHYAVGSTHSAFTFLIARDQSLCFIFGIHSFGVSVGGALKDRRVLRRDISMLDGRSSRSQFLLHKEQSNIISSSGNFCSLDRHLLLQIFSNQVTSTSPYFFQSTKSLLHSSIATSLLRISSATSVHFC